MGGFDIRSGTVPESEKELEKALEFSRMETEARDLLITRAEELFDIPIRKNLGPNSHGTGP